MKAVTSSADLESSLRWAALPGQNLHSYQKTNTFLKSILVSQGAYSGFRTVTCTISTGLSATSRKSFANKNKKNELKPTSMGERT